MIYNLPSGEQATAPQPTMVSPSETHNLPPPALSHMLGSCLVLLCAAVAFIFCHFLFIFFAAAFTFCSAATAPLVLFWFRFLFVISDIACMLVRHLQRDENLHLPPPSPLAYTIFINFDSSSLSLFRASHENMSSAGDPSHVLLQLTPSWTWQRFFEQFKTVVVAQQLDRFINGWSMVLRLCVF